MNEIFEIGIYYRSVKIFYMSDVCTIRENNCINEFHQYYSLK